MTDGTSKPVVPWIWTGMVGFGALAASVFIDNGGSAAWERVAIVALPTFLCFLGSVVGNQRPGNPIGWLLLITGVGVFVSGTLEVLYGTNAGPPVQPSFWDYTLIWVASGAGFLIFYPMFLLLYIFPTGRFLSKRWSWALWLPVVFITLTLFLAAFSETVGPLFADQGEVRWAIANPIGFVPIGVLDTVVTATSGLLVVMLPLGGVISLIARYRKSSLLVRTQIRWILYGSLIAGMSYPLGVWLLADSPLWSGVFTLLAIAVVPVTITVAVTRYRLFDIDRLISRTVSYALVVALLGLVFATGVVWIPTALGLADTPLVVAASTLAVAGLFNPLRKRAQRLVDRRFNRSSYDAEQVAEQFADRMQETMTQTELTTILLKTVNTHFAPSVSSVWLNDE